MQNIYKKAAETKLRFSTAQGKLSVEDLFDLDLQHLDSLALALTAQVDSTPKTSFLAKSSTKVDPIVLLKIEILKDVIQTKEATIEQKEQKAVLQSELSKIDAAMAKHNDSKYDNMSPEELIKARTKLTKKA